MPNWEHTLWLSLNGVLSHRLGICTYPLLTSWVKAMAKGKLMCLYHASLLAGFHIKALVRKYGIGPFHPRKNIGAKCFHQKASVLFPKKYHIIKKYALNKYSSVVKDMDLALRELLLGTWECFWDLFKRKFFYLPSLPWIHWLWAVRVRYPG